MPQELRQSGGEDKSLEEEGSSLIRKKSLPPPSENRDTAAVEELTHDQNVNNVNSKQTSKKIVDNSKSIIILKDFNFKDVPLFLSEELDRKGLFEGFVFILREWTSTPYIKLEGLGWLFKLFLWCVR